MPMLRSVSRFRVGVLVWAVDDVLILGGGAK